ncbi:MAG TPA: hypothetical protein VE684_09950 [Crenalkalicoccus sp.]|jgi:hypothetical protein|nr:hypothetical protein [Crenalkalicoccus sp.]
MAREKLSFEGLAPPGGEASGIGGYGGLAWDNLVVVDHGEYAHSGFTALTECDGERGGGHERLRQPADHLDRRRRLHLQGRQLRRGLE